jgi:2-methylisocitrate lyase-like PEP mutase family enzyme
MHMRPARPASRPTMASALAAERPLVMPLAHDALSARLISGAGFRAFAIGGSAMLAARYALPDLGLVGLTDMVAGIRDIADATDLPFMADGDDGYGDVKATVRMVRAYERIGVGAILIEDQLRDVKQQRANMARGVAEPHVIEQKLRAALAERTDPHTMIIGRTDAYGVHGLDEALRRAERFVQLGCEGIFVAGLRTLQELERVGRTLRGVALLSAALFETPGMPWPAPIALAQMGFTQVSYPASMILRVAAALQVGLLQLRRHATEEAPMTADASLADIREVLDQALQVDDWQRIETSYAMEQPESAEDRDKRRDETP